MHKLLAVNRILDVLFDEVRHWLVCEEEEVLLPDRLPPAELEWPPEEEPPPPPAEEEEWPELAERMDLCETETGFPDSADSSFAELTEACDSVFEPLSATEPPSLPVAASERLSSVAPLDAEEEEEPAEEDEEPSQSRPRRRRSFQSRLKMSCPTRRRRTIHCAKQRIHCARPRSLKMQKMRSCFERLKPPNCHLSTIQRRQWRTLEAFGGPAPAEDE
ncbi:hypothetical protein TYRP_006009 [Tyrophagus putrescentiae]|nr:hypothetical protein TYRP_006009 [Tyrophagus putrescentiae]